MLYNKEGAPKLLFPSLAAAVLTSLIWSVCICKSVSYRCIHEINMAKVGLVQQPTCIGPMWIPAEYYQSRVLTLDSKLTDT